jgi:hypothetical protein
MLTAALFYESDWRRYSEGKKTGREGAFAFIEGFARRAKQKWRSAVLTPRERKKKKLTQRPRSTHAAPHKIEEKKKTYSSSGGQR